MMLMILRRPIAELSMLKWYDVLVTEARISGLKLPHEMLILEFLLILLKLSFGYFAGLITHLGSFHKTHVIKQTLLNGKHDKGLIVSTPFSPELEPI